MIGKEVAKLQQGGFRDEVSWWLETWYWDGRAWMGSGGHGMAWHGRWCWRHHVGTLRVDARDERLSLRAETW